MQYNRLKVLFMACVPLGAIELNVKEVHNDGRNKGGSSSFTSSQHYMALIDLNGSNIFVGNAYSNSGHGKAGWFNADNVLTSVQSADYCTPKKSR